MKVKLLQRFARSSIVCHRLLLILNCFFVVFLLAACAGHAPVNRQADALVLKGPGLEELMREAAISASPVRENLQLQAAEILMRQGNTRQALDLLFNIDPKYLSDRNYESYTLLYGQWAVDKEQNELARNILVNERIESLLPGMEAEQAVALYELRARFFVADRQPLRAITEHMAETPLLLSDDLQEKNNALIWSSLQQLSADELQQLNRQPNKQIGGWLELIHIASAQELDIDAQVTLLNEWLDRFPHHPAAQHLPPELRLLQAAIKQRPQQVTLLLPLSGNLQKAGEALRDGFMAAYYQAMNRHYPLPQVRVIDSQQEGDFLKLYDQIADNNTDLIIGPLEKEKIVLLQSRNHLPVPTLALNDPLAQNADRKTENLYLFGLNPEDEARQVATEARLNHHERALVIVPATDWGRRTSAAFMDEWQKQGGLSLGNILLDTNNDDYSNILQQALGISDSKTRKQWLRQWSADTLEFEPRRRQDIDMIFLAVRPEQARQIKPLLAFHYAGDIPVYAASSVYAGVSDPERDNDLNGVQLLVSPWLVESSELRQDIDRSLGTEPGFQPLYAMGADAWRLHARLPLLSVSERSRLHAYTGLLRMDNHQRIYRQQLWAVMNQGNISLMPALAP